MTAAAGSSSATDDQKQKISAMLGSSLTPLPHARRTSRCRRRVRRAPLCTVSSPIGLVIGHVQRWRSRWRSWRSRKSGGRSRFHGDRRRREASRSRSDRAMKWNSTLSTGFHPRFIAWVPMWLGFHPEETLPFSLINILPTQLICWCVTPLNENETLLKPHWDWPNRYVKTLVTPCGGSDRRVTQTISHVSVSNRNLCNK